MPSHTMPSPTLPLQAAANPVAIPLLQRLFEPLQIAAYVTWATIFTAVVPFSRLRAGDGEVVAGASVMIGMLVLFVFLHVREQTMSMRSRTLLVVAQAVLIVLAEFFLRGGQIIILLIIVAAQLVSIVSWPATIATLLGANFAFAWMWFSRTDSIATAMQWLIPSIGFQAFAALTGHYAHTRELAREHLAQVNAELLATRRLLEESARAGERLKLSRELHDVAGHTLTALKLNLAQLARDPVLQNHEEVALSTNLADELLTQIRQVVGALRAHDGLDLRAALEALAMQMPSVLIELDLEDGLRVERVDQAETLLRCAQEAITNAVRHGRATHIRIALARADDDLCLVVENDGVSPQTLHFGNGLRGMRERLQALGGVFVIAPLSPRGLRLSCTLPADT